MTRCDQTCLKYKATFDGKNRYAQGQKRCMICALFIWWDGLWCPCCGYRLRTKPRGSAWKAKYHDNTGGIERIG